MKSFWEELTSRVAAVNLKNPTHTPDAKLEEDFQIIGVANEAAQKFFVVWRDLSAEHDAQKERAMKKLDGDGKEADILAITREHDYIHELRDLAKSLFWNEVQTQFPDASSQGNVLAILEGWKVATGKREDESPFVGIEVVSLGGADGLGELIAREFGRGRRSR
jgi:hypothetical protein